MQEQIEVRNLHTIGVKKPSLLLHVTTVLDVVFQLHVEARTHKARSIRNV